MWRRNRHPGQAQAAAVQAPQPEHARLVVGLIAKTTADELIWGRSSDPLDVYGVDRTARLGAMQLRLGIADLLVFGEHASERIPCSPETSGLWDAVDAQEERLRRGLLADALAAVDRSSSGEHGPEGATGSADPSGPTNDLEVKS